MTEKIRKYINAIKNPAKKEYAKLYFVSKVTGAGSPKHPGCSVMAAQAVRMNIDALLEGRK
jgi:hypothetical protein